MGPRPLDGDASGACEVNKVSIVSAMACFLALQPRISLFGRR